MPNADDTKTTTMSEASRLLRTTNPTFKLYAERLGIQPHRPNGGGMGLAHPALYSKADIELVKLAIQESGSSLIGVFKKLKPVREYLADRAAALEEPKAAPENNKAPMLESVKAVEDLWSELKVAARKLAHLCQALRVSHFEIEIDQHGEPHVKYEMTQTGEVQL